MKEIESTTKHYCHATVSNNDDRPSENSYKPLFEDDDLIIEDDLPMDTIYYIETTYMQDSDNLVGAKLLNILENCNQERLCIKREIRQV